MGERRQHTQLLQAGPCGRGFMAWPISPDTESNHCNVADGDPVTARKDDAPAADQADITNVVGWMVFSGGGGLIQTTSG
jgi:hypothetical protein